MVIVDNGRSAMLAKGYDELLRCIRCGACMNTCPVYRRSGGHSYEAVVPGPVGSALAGAKTVQTHASLPFACSLCASCDAVCPVRIPLHHTLLKERSDAVTQPAYASKAKGLKLAAWLLRSPLRYRIAMALMRKLLPLLPRSLTERLGDPWTRGREMPKPAKRSFDKMLYELKTKS